MENLCNDRIKDFVELWETHFNTWTQLALSITAKPAQALQSNQILCVVLEF